MGKPWKLWPFFLAPLRLRVNPFLQPRHARRGLIYLTRSRKAAKKDGAMNYRL